MRTGSIYIIRNSINDKVYIGQTTMTVHERFMCHMKPSSAKIKRTYKLYQAILKYGSDKFNVETLEGNVPLSRLNETEIMYIDKYDSFNIGYNSTKGGDGRIINLIEDEDKLLNLAKQGFSRKELSKMFKVHEATISRTLHKLGFGFYDMDEETLRTMVTDGKSNQEIADFFGIHVKSVPRCLERYGLNKYNKKVANRDYFEYDALITDYYNQMPINKICDKYGISRSTFYRIKEKYCKNRPQIYKNKIRFYN